METWEAYIPKCKKICMSKVALVVRECKMHYMGNSERKTWKDCLMTCKTIFGLRTEKSQRIKNKVRTEKLIELKNEDSSIKHKEACLAEKSQTSALKGAYSTNFVCKRGTVDTV
jgi:hypothetical protein